MKSSRGCVVWLAAVDEVLYFEVRPGGDVRPMNKQWVHLLPGYRPRIEIERMRELIGDSQCRNNTMNFCIHALL